MKLRAKHIIVIVGLALAGFLGYALVFGQMQGGHAEDSASLAAEDIGFLEEVRQEADTAPADQEVGQEPSAGSDTGAVPDIQASTRSYDMGLIPNDKPTKGVVTLYNKGGAPLSISQIATSCGCTIGTVEQKTIPPGGEVPMEVVVNPARIYGFDSHKVLTVWSNDPDTPHLTVDVLAKVDPEYTVEPGQLDFGKVAKGEVLKGQVIVRQASDAPFEVKEAKPWGAPPGLEVSSEKRPESEWAKPGHAEYAVNVTVDTAQVPPGTYKAMGSIETDVKRVPRYTLNVAADVIAPYAVKPRPLSLGLIEPGKTAAATLTVSAEDPAVLAAAMNHAAAGAQTPTEPAAVAPAAPAAAPTPVTVSDVALSGKEMTATVEPAADGGSVVIRVNVAPEAAGGAKREQLSFTVNVGGATFKESVPVTAVVTRTSPAPATQGS